MTPRMTPWIVAAFALLLVAPVNALVIERGDLRLTLHENSSRFSLALRDGSRWDPLFYDEDPETSSMDVLEGNQIYRLGDAGRFAQTLEETDLGARVTFESNTLRVVQEFRFTRSLDSVTENAVELRVTVTNLGEAPVTTGVRFIYDTFLGERSNTHFINSAGQVITRESEIAPGVANQYLRSVESATAESGFQVMLTGERVTSPATVIAGNWQRLSDSSWNFAVNPTRNFNRLPYSINDSGLMLIYPTVQLARAESASFVSYLGDLAAGGYADPASLMATAERASLLQELVALIERIEQLEQSDSVDVAQIQSLTRELQALSERIRGE